MHQTAELATTKVPNPRPVKTGPEALTWYAVHTKPTCEGLAEFHLRRQGYRIFAPWYPAAVIRNRRLGMERRSWFPRYVFLGLAKGQSIEPVNSTVGVSTVIYSGEDPLVVPWPVMDAMIEAAEFDGVMVEESIPNGPQVGEVRNIVGGAFIDRLAEIAGRVDKTGHVAVLIGRLRASLPASQLGGIASPGVR